MAQLEPQRSTLGRPQVQVLFLLEPQASKVVGARTTIAHLGDKGRLSNLCVLQV